ncbi:alpha/beta hydrolase [Rhodopirellula sp. JC639]|uniref:alpha/beta hydrolase n=1 Tax=Stieleria mannarensis TaxID=2755585 RepID=UPI0016014E5A|nr:alpha/beta-hydrolase family protein [Rhodopirellula sp. JC639]
MKQRLANYWDSFSFVGLIVATLFFAASLTPSLLPRNYWVQGILSGFSLAIGYGVGIAVLTLYRFFELREPTGKTQRIAKRVTVALVAVVSVAFVWRMTFWQNSIRERMEMPRLETAYPYRVALIAVVCAVILIAGGRMFVRCGHFISAKLQRVMPRRMAQGIGFTTAVLLVLFLTNDVIAVGLLRSADAFFLNMDQLVDDDTGKPTDPMLTGSDSSLVTWETIGRQGKGFLSDGPTKAEIAAVTGAEAKQPIRVYVGMRSRPTAQERAELALRELKRVGGFERSVLVVATPTGTGWLDPSAVDTLEYLHGGDSAIVSTQYSYLPSWITILVDPRRSIESAEALFEVIYGYWKTLPKDARPKLYLHGLSLGSLGSEVSADLFTIFEDPIDGAVWSGPPFPSQNWKLIVRNRNEGTPAWLPEFRDSRILRFTSQRNALDPDAPWGPMRCVYVQYASDPMVWFSPDLAWNRPDWLGDRRGPDVSPHLRWYPLVTLLQVAFDLPVATAVPLGYGHNYSPSSYIDAWIAVTDPKGWTADQTETLKAMFKSRETPKP